MAPIVLQRSDEDIICAELLRGSRQGDWNAVLMALERLNRVAAPPTSAAIHDRARVLEEALMTAKATRADLAGSLVRLSAASRFSACRNTGESAKF